MTFCMNKPVDPPVTPSRAKRVQPEPNSREARLAEALRANLRRRKAAVRTPVDDGVENDSDAAQTASEKSPDPS
ncbi:hypothetical protein C7435_2746 [Maricaulis maris]|uniref:Uncharacterized protein n=1 Tax=Maricaulis maris TaxID=74318 RepID=A0A495D268_9PROT|nr:hypothetical protein C7435_2746 [Maricaulis maris]